MGFLVVPCMYMISFLPLTICISEAVRIIAKICCAKTLYAGICMRTDDDNEGDIELEVRVDVETEVEGISSAIAEPAEDAMAAILEDDYSKLQHTVVDYIKLQHAVDDLNRCQRSSNKDWIVVITAADRPRRATRTCPSRR